MPVTKAASSQGSSKPRATSFASSNARYCQKLCIGNRRILAKLTRFFDLFFSIDKFDPDNDFGDQLRAVEPAPVFLGFHPQFEDHGQCRDSRAGTFSSMGSKPDGSKSGFDGISGPYMRPMLGREVIEGKEDFFIFLQAFAGLREFGLVTGDELVVSCQSRFAGRCQVHFMDQLLGLALNTFGHFIKDIGCLMYPAPLLRYGTIFFLQGVPKA